MEEESNIIKRGTVESFAIKDVCGESLFVVLKSDDPVFNGVRGEDVMNMDVFGLSDAMGTVNSLSVNGMVPPRVNEDDVIGGSDVESDSATLNVDEKDFECGVIIELA